MPSRCMGVLAPSGRLAEGAEREAKRRRKVAVFALDDLCDRVWFGPDHRADDGTPKRWMGGSPGIVGSNPESDPPSPGFTPVEGLAARVAASMRTFRTLRGASRPARISCPVFRLRIGATPLGGMGSDPE